MKGLILMDIYKFIKKVFDRSIFIPKKQKPLSIFSLKYIKDTLVHIYSIYYYKQPKIIRVILYGTPKLYMIPYC